MKQTISGLIGWMLLATPFSTSPAADLLDHPDRQRTLAEVRGRVQSVDAATRQLLLKDDAGQMVAVMVIPDTRILDGHNHEIEWTALRPGERLLIYYNTREH